MGDFMFWLGIVISLLPMALGVMLLLRRKGISARHFRFV
jgi:hypothetical protein